MRTIFIACVALTRVIGCALHGIISSAEHEFEMGLSFFNRGQYDEAVPNGANLSCLSMISVPVLNLFHFVPGCGH